MAKNKLLSHIEQNKIIKMLGSDFTFRNIAKSLKGDPRIIAK